MITYVDTLCNQLITLIIPLIRNKNIIRLCKNYFIQGIGGLMDVLYIGSIPKEYHFAVWGSDYITLYNRPNAQNTTLPYYRIYFNAPGFYYSEGSTTFSQNNTTTFQNIEVSDKWYYRKDNINILFFTCVIAVATIWFVNLFTSIFKKGGLLSGLF